MKFFCLLVAAASAQTCLHTGRAVDAEIVAPMVRAVDAETHETYVWFQGNELNGGKHLNAKCPTCTGGATFQFDVKKAGKYTFQADLIAPNNRDDSLYVTTSVDRGTPYQWSIGVFTSWTNRDIEGIKDKYFPAGTHSITLKPREDGTKVRALKVTTGSENVCFKKAQAPKPKCNAELATDAEIIAPMVARDGYVWLQGNELNGGKHFNAKCPTCKGGVKFQFNIKKAGKYTFQADVIAPNNRDDSFYVTTSLDTDTPYKWDVGKSMGLSTVWKWGDIAGIKDKYFSVGTHSITLKPREDGTKVRALRVTTGSNTVCFKTAAAPPTNTGSVNAPSCTLEAGKRICSTTVTWTSTSPSACIYLEPTGQLFACKGLGTHSQVAAWISARPLDFVLHERRSPASLKLGSAVAVRALQAPKKSAKPTASPTTAPTGILGHATCKHTICTYTHGTTLVNTSRKFHDKWHCEKVGNGCKCVCHASLKCALRHHHTTGYKKTITHC